MRIIYNFFTRFIFYLVTNDMQISQKANDRFFI